MSNADQTPTPFSILDAAPPPAVPQAAPSPATVAPELPARFPDGIPVPRATTGGRELVEVLLPSGRGVRLRRLTTQDFLAAREAAAASAGDPERKPDPRGVRYTGALDRECTALAVVSFTAEFDWTDTLRALTERARVAHEQAQLALPEDQRAAFVPVPTPAGELLGLLPESAWCPTTPLKLLTPGADCLEELFRSPADWMMLTQEVGRLLAPTRSLAGIAGKGRTVVR